MQTAILKLEEIMKIRFGIWLVLLLSVGCASTDSNKPTFKTTQMVAMPDTSKSVVNTQKARIYLMRPSVFGGLASMKVFDGETQIGNIRGNSYLCWDRDPGTLELHDTAENKSHMELKVEAGHTYYILQKVRMGWIKPCSDLSEIPEDEAQRYLATCKAAKIKE